MKEKVLQTKILKFLRRVPVSWWVKFPGGMFGQLGVPDILGCHYGRFYAFEVKRPKTKDHPAGKPTKIQLKAIELIRTAGGYANIVYSLQEVEDVINNT